MWSTGADYERYMGRWSRLVAARFVPWLEVKEDASWLDVGCGVGALASTILDLARPATVKGIDPSDGFIEEARVAVPDERVEFLTGDARSLPFAEAAFEAVTSGLVLNFVPEPAQAVVEMARVATPGGVVGAYVWDYAGKMDLFSIFWREAVRLDPDASSLDQARKFGALTQPDALAGLWQAAGLIDVTTDSLEIDLDFRDFDDFWTPFLGGQGGAPTYVATLTTDQVDQLRAALRSVVPVAPDGSIRLGARAWAVKGKKAD